MKISKMEFLSAAGLAVLLFTTALTGGAPSTSGRAIIFKCDASGQTQGLLQPDKPDKTSGLALSLNHPTLSTVKNGYQLET